MFTVPLHLVRKLLSTECVLLSELGKSVAFEIAVGMNGRVWVRAKTVRDTICIANAIAAAEFMDNEEIRYRGFNVRFQPFDPPTFVIFAGGCRQS